MTRKFVLLLLACLAMPAVALSIGLPKCATVPDHATGLVVMHYRISRSCRVKNVRFENPQTPKSLQTAMICLAEWPALKRRQIDHQEHVLKEAEYDKLVAQARQDHPERYHTRYIDVKTENGESAEVACYFDKGWTRTVTIITDQNGESKPFSDFSSLPTQTRTIEFKNADP